MPIKYVGLFDCVVALGIDLGPLSRYARRFTSLPSVLSSQDYLDLRGVAGNLQKGRHALALDEHRQGFAPTLWTAPRVDDLFALPNASLPDGCGPFSDRLEQRWFVGCHG